MGEEKIVVMPPTSARTAGVILFVWTLPFTVFCATLLVARLTSPQRNHSAEGLVIFGGPTLLCVWVLMRLWPGLFAGWEADEQVLRCRGWCGTTAMRWDEIARYRLKRGHGSLEYSFYDSAGRRRASVNFGFLGEAGRPLFQLMQRKLREVLPAQNHDLPDGLGFRRWRLMLESPESSDSPR